MPATPRPLTSCSRGRSGSTSTPTVCSSVVRQPHKSSSMLSHGAHAVAARDGCIERRATPGRPPSLPAPSGTARTPCAPRARAPRRRQGSRVLSLAPPLPPRGPVGSRRRAAAQHLHRPQQPIRCRTARSSPGGHRPRRPGSAVDADEAPVRVDSATAMMRLQQSFDAAFVSRVSRRMPILMPRLCRDYAGGRPTASSACSTPLGRAAGAASRPAASGRSGRGSRCARHRRGRRVADRFDSQAGGTVRAVLDGETERVGSESSSSSARHRSPVRRARRRTGRGRTPGPCSPTGSCPLPGARSSRGSWS